MENNQFDLENLKKDIIDIENKIKYLKNLLEIIFYDVDIRGNKLSFENTISTTEDILECIRLKELHKNKLLLLNKIKNNSSLEKIIEINKYISKLITKDQYSVNNLLLSNENIIYYDFLVKHDKEFIDANFDKYNFPKKNTKRIIRH